MFTLSLDSQASAAGLARLRQEVEEALGLANDPLEILIAEEEGQFDDVLALAVLNTRHHNRNT